MLKLFKSKVALIPLLFILALMIFLRANVFISQYYVDCWQGELAPFSNFLYHLFGASAFKSLWFHMLVSLILIFLQSSIIISIVSKFKTREFTGFLIAWLYVLLMHLFPIFILLSPQLLALTFILLAFKSILQIEEKRNKTAVVFNTGLFIGLASSFWTPSLIFLLLALFVLFKTNEINIRNLMVLIIAYTIPYLYTASYFLLTDQKLKITQALIFNQFDFNLYKPGQLLSVIFLGLLILISLSYVFQFLSKQLIQVKEFFSYVFFYVFCVFLLFFIQNENTINVLIFLIFPISLFLNILFNRIKRNFLAESLHLILLLSIVVNFLYFIK